MELTALVDTSILAAESGVGPLDLGGAWAVSIVTVGELEAGVLLARTKRARAARLQRLGRVLDDARAIPIDRAVSARYAQLRADVGRVGSNDLWIAATALALGLTLVTADKSLAALPQVETQLVAIP